MSEHDLRALLALVEKHLGRSWLDISDWLRAQNGLDAIEAKLRAGDYYGVVTGIEDAARRFATESHSQFILAGRRQSEWLDSKLPDKLVRFNADNDRAVRAAQRNELELVHGLSMESRQTLQQVIVDGQRAGLNPRAMARDIRDSIGLTPQQERAVRSYRQALEQADWSNALGRELSSGHSDRTIRSARDRDRSLTADQIDQAVERYRANQLTARAETIARTESSRNVHAGLAEAVNQALERGDVKAEQMAKEWIHGRVTLHARPSHQALHRTQVPWNGAFDVGGVQMRYPHDPTAPASEVVSCGCTFATVLNL